MATLAVAVAAGLHGVAFMVLENKVDAFVTSDFFADLLVDVSADVVGYVDSARFEELAELFADPSARSEISAALLSVRAIATALKTAPK